MPMVSSRQPRCDKYRGREVIDAVSHDGSP
jgi:hypothetical protein